MIPEKPALGLDHRKSDVSDLRPCKGARTREHPSSGGGNRFSDKGMRKSNEYRARDRRRAVMTSRNNPVGLALACAIPMVLFSPANAQQDGLVTERNISLN